MNCKTAGPLLIGYLEGSLNPKTYSELNDHLNICKKCSNDLYELSVMENMIHSSFPNFDNQILLDDVMQSIRSSALSSSESEQEESSNIIQLDFVNESSVAADFIPAEFKKGFWYSFRSKRGLVAAAFFILLAFPFFILFNGTDTGQQDFQAQVIRKAVFEELRTYYTVDNYVKEVHELNFSGTNEAVPVEFLLGVNQN